MSKLLSERQTKCKACYQARVEYLPLCDIYQNLYRKGIIEIGERCTHSRIFDEDLEKIVLGYDNLVNPEIALVLMEDPPIEK